MVAQRRAGSLAQGTCGSRGGGVPLLLRPFPSPSAQGPNRLMGSPAPPSGSREASDWLRL